MAGLSASWSGMARPSFSTRVGNSRPSAKMRTDKACARMTVLSSGAVVGQGKVRQLAGMHHGAFRANAN